MLTKKGLLNRYNYFKSAGTKAFKNNQAEKSLVLLRYASYIAWQYPVLPKFVDEELEDLLEEIGQSIVQIPERKNPDRKKAVLFSSQVIDCGALTEQFLYYLGEHDYDVLFIAPSKENTIHGPGILKYVEQHPRIELFIPPSADYTGKIKEVSEKIAAFNPGLGFLHFLPDDVIGYCAFVKFKNMIRYYIVHNDHTFWLGKKCSDYFIEFRKFGYLMGNQRRGIPFEKLYLLAYYPINNKEPFQGFPFEREGKIIGITGAALYKYLMDSSLGYLKAIRDILRQNPNFILCICGWGPDADTILKIYEEEGIRERVFFLGRRKDFYALIGQSDILFESYPFKGGLTLGFATEQGIAATGMGNSRDGAGTTQDYFALKDYVEPMDIPSFVAEANMLIGSKDKRTENAKKLGDNKFNKKDFTIGLTKILEQNDCSAYMPEFKDPMTLDDDYFLSEYILLPRAERGFYKNEYQILKPILGSIGKLRIFLSYAIARLKGQ